VENLRSEATLERTGVGSKVWVLPTPFRSKAWVLPTPFRSRVRVLPPPSRSQVWVLPTPFRSRCGYYLDDVPQRLHLTSPAHRLTLTASERRGNTLKRFKTRNSEQQALSRRRYPGT